MSLLESVHGYGATGSKPAAAAANKGYLYFDTTLSRLERSNGATWDVIEPASSGIPATIFDAADDLIVASAADTAARLATANSSYLGTSGAGAVAWKAAPTASAYKRTTGAYTTTSATFVDVDATNLALTITTLARRVMVGFNGTISHSGTSFVCLTVDLDGVNLGNAATGGIGGIISPRSPVANYHMNGSFTFLTDVLSAGSHTFKLQWCTNAATASMKGGDASTSTGQFWVAETMIVA